MTKICWQPAFFGTEPDVRELFAQHGTVESVALPTDRETGRPRASGCRMPQADAQRAMQASTASTWAAGRCASMKRRIVPAPVAAVRAAAAVAVVAARRLRRRWW
jgi:hypothetical protein